MLELLSVNLRFQLGPLEMYSSYRILAIMLQLLPNVTPRQAYNYFNVD